MRMGAMQNIVKGRVGLVGCLEWFLRGIMILRGAALAAGLSRHILVSILGPASLLRFDLIISSIRISTISFDLIITSISSINISINIR